MLPPPDPIESLSYVVPVSREDIEDCYGPQIIGEVREDYEAGCSAWLVEHSAFRARIIGPAFGWERP